MCAQALDGKVIVVVGGTSGLGRSGVEACLEAGARVIAIGRSPEKVEAVDGLGAEVFGQVGDAADPDCAEAAIDEAESRFGGFDGLYHVAGGSGRSVGDGPLHELADEGIDYTLRLNLSSVIYSNRAAVRRLLKLRRRGSVLNMSSVLAFAPAGEHFATHAYAAAKAGAINFTKTLAVELAEHRIRVNAIAPDFTWTEGLAAVSAGGTEAVGMVPMRRAGHVDDIAGTAIFLASDLSTYLTGDCLHVDGGTFAAAGWYPHPESGRYVLGPTRPAKDESGA